MVDTDGVDPANDIEKTYSYVTTDAVAQPSGLLMSNFLQYHYKTFVGDLAYDNGLFTERINYLIRSSPTYPLSTGAQGSVVGYSVVSVVNGKNSEGGKVIYGYENTPDALPVIPFIPDNPVSNTNEINGMLRNEYAYEKVTSGYRPVRTVDYLNRSRTLTAILGAKLYNYQVPGGGYTLRGKGYSSFTKWNYDSLQTSIDYYYDAGGTPTMLTTIKRNYHDNPVHYQATRMEQESSDGTKVGVLTTYPDDYASGSGFIDQMQLKNIAYLPIETVNYRVRADGAIRVLKGQLTTYRTDCPTCKDQTFLTESASSIDKSVFKVSSLASGQFPGDAGASAQAFGRDATYQARVKYDSYDANWNVTQYTVDGISNGMSWDASATYPTAMVQNVGGTPSLQTAYTIDPLLGQTQKTDPNGMTTTYDYDGLGRLKAIHNTQGDIVKGFAYHYRPITPPAVTPSVFTITGVTMVSCQTVTATQRAISITPQYAAINGQPISFSVDSQLLPTTNPGPYTLNMFIDSPNITLRAVQSGVSSSFTYNWLAACTGTTPNQSPIVRNMISNQQTTVGQAFSFSIPVGTFADDNGMGNLSYAVSGLPTGLSFATGNQTISGTANTTGSFTVMVTATDAGGLSTSTSFLLTVSP